MKAWRLGFKEVAGAGLAVASGNDLKETAKATLSHLNPELCDALCDRVQGWGAAGATLFVLAMFLAHRTAERANESESEATISNLLTKLQTIEENQWEWFNEHDRRRVLGDHIWNLIQTDVPDELKEDTGYLIQHLFDEKAEQRLDNLEERLNEKLGEPARRRAVAMAYINPKTARTNAQLVEAVREDLQHASRGEGQSLFGMLQGLVEHFLLPKVYLPVASAPNEPQGTASRLRFYERLVPDLVGRDAELRDLQGFLDRKDPLLWWLWTADGGQGKSRLALELLYRNYGSWRGGFVRGSFDAQNNRLLFPDLSQWEPVDDTLFVVDYVSGYATQVRRALEGLTLNGRHHSFRKRVRFLLLERYYGRHVGWASELHEGGEGSAHEAPRRLAPLDEESLLRIFDQATYNWAGAFPPAERRQRAKLLFAREDRVRWRRPLYAAMLALAFHEGEELEDISALDDYVLHHEEQLWRDHYQVGQAEVNAAFFATIMGGVTHDQLSTATRPEYGIVAPHGEKIIQVVSHSEADGSCDYSSLEPDPLGERFVRRRLAGDFFRHNNAGEAEVRDWSKKLFRHAVSLTDWSEPE